MKVITEVAPKKKKRFNKNKKKAWRKKINIDDIEDHLEEKRREERHGGPLEERVTEELFSLDYGEDDIKLNHEGKPSATLFTCNDNGLKPLFNRQEKKTLNCHQFINGLPGAKAISVKRGTMKQKEKRVIKYSKKLASGTPAAEIKKKRLRQQRKIDLKRKCKIEKPNYDRNLWETSPIIEGKFSDVSKTYLTEPVLFYKVQTKQAKVKTPSVRYEKPSLLPSVVVPKAGASYNPSYDDHQKLLAEALEVEKERKKKEEKIKRMRVKYKPNNDGITELEKMVEMTEGLPLNPNQDYETYNFSEEEEENEESENYISNKKIEKRSLQSRKKAKTLKIKEQKRLKLKERKMRENDINRLKSLEKNIAKEEKESEQLKKKKKRLQKLKDQYQTKKLSRYEFQDNDDVIPLGNELAESLRTMEPVGNPLESVFKSLQRRNIIEKRVKVRRAKAKKKMIKKKSCVESLNYLLNEPE
ncbi:Glioma tumor suppressor candidate region protein 2 [Armadillidium nasatum]|uniref:Ribosome biogenesis protein NOP53 n=1 Tax=Armadillidium nasatum TaxID=96803 RepID=A0A5N5T379_9CRUS|nr:Glioma tumor suppressor candidate region protein 2 [Armadillidium nasatum]